MKTSHAFLAALISLGGWASATPVAVTGQTPAANDLDAFMAKVLERRNDNWRTLHDYILSEREQFELTGPSEQRLYGRRRDFTWFVRDGYLVRSPVAFDGVAPDVRARQDYEDRWLREEQGREKREAEKAKQARDRRGNGGDASAEPGSHAAEAGDDGAGADLLRRGLEPRFISEAYFMRFRFDPGNYFLAGRETMDGRAVLRIEYYPTRLFADDDEQSRGPERDRKDEAKRDGAKARDDSVEKDIERKFNKVALVTLWVDPAEHQIVQYTFENTDLNFLPGRSMVRIGDVSASMAMGQYFGRVWLPRRIGVQASVTLANGTYDARYGREFFDYRQGEVKARIRSYTPQD